MSAAAPNALARTLRSFFGDHLPRVRGVSPHTILSYRDAFTLLLRFLAAHCGRAVVDLDLVDLEPDAVLTFLHHLEAERGNGPSTRNARLAAVHAFARYAATSQPEHLERCQRLLAIPFKRARPRVVEYLEMEEMRALLAAPDPQTPAGRRDHALLLALFNTGARVQEILDVRPCDLQLARPLQVRLRGKGRKERVCPLWPQTAEVFAALLRAQRLAPDAMQPLFRSARGQPLTRFGARYLLRKYVARVQSTVPTLTTKRVHPHTLRHTTAVHLLQAGVDLVTISHWLGHASVETTNRYAAVDLEMKRAAIAKAHPDGLGDVSSAWRSDATIMDWLKAL
ncbi:MAG: site-specific integrase [Candidatus Binatia bacterium]